MTTHDDDHASEKTPWHLDKKVPLGMMLAISMLLVNGLWAIADIKSDIALLKADSKVLHDHDNDAAAAMKEALELLREQYRKLDSKIDRLIERGKK